MFPQSKEVMSYVSGKTISTILVQELASHYTKHMIDAMKTVPFCIATDGGNDRAMELTLYPILVTYFDKSAFQIQTSLLSVPSLNKDSTGHNIAGLLIEEFLNFGIPWKNCIGITTDNANVMIGTTNGIS